MNSEGHQATQAAGMHVGASNDLKWQQDFDFTTGWYYYYRRSTQVRYVQKFVLRFSMNRYTMPRKRLQPQPPSTKPLLVFTLRNNMSQLWYLLQETQWEAPGEGYLPASEYWLSVKQAEWLATQDMTNHESAEHMITKKSAALVTADHPLISTNEAGDSLSRLALDDADTPSCPQALADAAAQPPPAPSGACDSTHPAAATETAARDAADKPPVAQSAAATHTSRQGASAAASASASTSAAAGTNLGAAMPAARIESTGVMASIPAPQGRHIRYDSTDADSDSDSMPAQFSPVPLQGATAEPSPSSACMLNSVDQQAVLDAVTIVDAPGCTSASSVSNSLISDGADVSDAMIEDAMQGVSATTVVIPTVLDQATQASSVLADALPERETSALTQSSTLHADSSADSALRQPCSPEANHAQSLVNGEGSAVTPAYMAGTCNVDLEGGSQPQQECSQEAGSPFSTTLEEFTMPQHVGVCACVYMGFTVCRAQSYTLSACTDLNCSTVAKLRLKSGLQMCCIVTVKYAN